MSTPQNQPPYRPPYQAVPPYGQQRPRPTHVGKLITAIILLVAGPFLGLLIAGIGSAIVAATTAASGDVVTNGQQVALSNNDERTLYVSDDAFARTCTVTAPDGKEVPTSRSTGTHISNNNGEFDSALTFTADKAGDYRVSCEGLSDTDRIYVGPTFTFSRFTGLWCPARFAGSSLPSFSSGATGPWPRRIKRTDLAAVSSNRCSFRVSRVLVACPHPARRYTGRSLG